MKLRNLLFLVLLLSVFIASPNAYALDEVKNTDPDKYYVLLDVKSQIVTVYEQDENGEYTRIVRRMVCTSGQLEDDPIDPEDLATPTPRGVWKVGARERFGKFASFSNEYARYWTQVVDGIFFHSIMFRDRDPETLKSFAYRDLGQALSHGCIRLYVEDAKWIYYHIPPGTTVNVSYSEDTDKELANSLKHDMDFDDYEAFQMNIFDVEPLPDRTAYVMVDDAPLRTGNGSNDEIIKRVAEGTEIIVLQEGDPWIKAEIDGREGYMKRAYISYTEGVLEADPEGPIVGSTVYLYEEPDTDSRRICKVAHDTSLVILEEGEDFAKVQYFTEVGYIQNRSIRYDWSTIYEETE